MPERKLRPRSGSAATADDVPSGPMVWLVGALFILLAFGVLYATSVYNYLLFHSLAEGFTVAVAVGVAMLAWNSRDVLDNDYFLLVGIGYASVAAVDLIHALAFPGMGVFPEYGTDLAIQLWVGARYLQGLTLLLAPLVVNRSLRPRVTLAGSAGVTTLLVGVIFAGMFPVCWTAETGPTLFKVGSELLVCEMLLGGAWLLYRRRAAFEKGVLHLLLGAILLAVASELSFTFYGNTSDLYVVLGHSFKVVSYYLIYKAVIVTGLASPYNLLYHRLSESERRYRTLFNNMTEGFALHEIVTDEEGRPTDYRFVEVNPAFEDMIDLGRDEIVGRTVRQVFPNTESFGIETCAEVAFTGGSAHFENYSEDLDRWYEVLAYQTSPGRFAALLNDITERKHAEEALRESEQRYHDLFTNMSQGFGLLESITNEVGETTGYRIVDANPATEEVIGFKREDVLGKRLRQVMPGIQSYWLEGVEETESTGRPVRMENYVSEVDSWFEVHAYRTNPGRIGVLFSDITERKKAEQELRELNAELEARVEQRTAEVEQRAEQLQRLALELASAEDRERRKLARVLHDDLQQTLAYAKLRAGVFGSAEDAELQQAAEEVTEALGEAIQTSRSLSHELAPPMLHTQGLGPALDYLASNMAARYGFEIGTDVEKEVSDMPEQRRNFAYRATRELLYNAVKHSEVDQAKLEMLQRNDNVRIVVEDDGVGFDPDDLEEQPVENRGLGLFSIEERVALLGGILVMDSTPGEGSRFELVIPLNPSSEDPKATHTVR